MASHFQSTVVEILFLYLFVWLFDNEGKTIFIKRVVVFNLVIFIWGWWSHFSIIWWFNASYIFYLEEPEH